MKRPELKLIVAIGYIIMRLRKMAGLTQAQLAKEAGIHVAGLSKLERGKKTSINAMTLFAIASALSEKYGALARVSSDDLIRMGQRLCEGFDAEMKNPHSEFHSMAVLDGVEQLDGKTLEAIGFWVHMPQLSNSTIKQGGEAK